jgi:hypothetical protein
VSLQIFGVPVPGDADDQTKIPRAPGLDTHYRVLNYNRTGYTHIQFPGRLEKCVWSRFARQSSLFGCPTI